MTSTYRSSFSDYASFGLEILFQKLEETMIVPGIDANLSLAGFAVVGNLTKGNIADFAEEGEDVVVAAAALAAVAVAAYEPWLAAKIDAADETSQTAKIAAKIAAADEIRQTAKGAAAYPFLLLRRRRLTPPGQAQ